MQNNSIICTSEKAVFNRIKLWGASSCKEKISGVTGHNELKFRPHIGSTNADFVLDQVYQVCDQNSQKKL